MEKTIRRVEFRLDEPVHIFPQTTGLSAERRLGLRDDARARLPSLYLPRAHERVPSTVLRRPYLKPRPRPTSPPPVRAVRAYDAAQADAHRPRRARWRDQHLPHARAPTREAVMPHERLPAARARTRYDTLPTVQSEPAPTRYDTLPTVQSESPPSPRPRDAPPSDGSPQIQRALPYDSLAPSRTATRAGPRSSRLTAREEEALLRASRPQSPRSAPKNPAGLRSRVTGSPPRDAGSRPPSVARYLAARLRCLTRRRRKPWRACISNALGELAS